MTAGPASHTEEIVSVQTADGLTHDGVVIRPASPPHKPIALIWFHGLTGRFYGKTPLTIGRALARAGRIFVSGNNRGHDFGYVMRRDADDRVILGGGGWELFSESAYDVAAWVDFAMTQGVEGVLLVGHSLGALKVGHYQAERQDSRVRGLVAASPPRFARAVDPELIARAERLVAEDRAQDLMPWGISRAGAGTVSAQTYLDRARTNLDVFGFHPERTPHARVASIKCPLFACYGTDEAWVGGAAELESIKRNATAAPRVETALFEGADHSYAGHEHEVANTLARWAESLI